MSRVQQSALIGNGAAMFVKLAAGCLVAIGLAGCEVHQGRGMKVGKMVVTHAKDNHPIIVEKKMVKLKIPVRRGDYGLSEESKMQLGHFIGRYREGGEGRLIVAPPAGQPNEVAAYNVLGDVKSLLQANDISRDMVKLAPYSPKGDPEAPIIISYLGYTVKGPECGAWTEDASGNRLNAPFQPLACANQANFAAMVANPRDLVEPRTETPRPGERRDTVWEQYRTGDVTGSEKSEDQKATLSDEAGTD
jgi:pilus assembly protein CpaD